MVGRFYIVEERYCDAGCRSYLPADKANRGHQTLLSPVFTLHDNIEYSEAQTEDKEANL